MTFILSFFWGFLLSFVGSIPFGVINLTVADMTIQKGIKAGLWLGVGAAIVEFFQAILALTFYNSFVQDPSLEQPFQVAAFFVFSTLGFYYFFKKPKEVPIPNQIKKKTSFSKTPFFVGVLLGVLNFLAIPYWIFYAIFLDSMNLLRTDSINMVLFAAGVAIGALLLFYIYAKLSLKLVEKTDRVTKLMSKIIGGIFLALALSALIKLWIAGRVVETFH